MNWNTLMTSLLISHGVCHISSMWRGNRRSYRGLDEVTSRLIFVLRICCCYNCPKQPLHGHFFDRQTVWHKRQNILCTITPFDSNVKTLYCQTVWLKLENTVLSNRLTQTWKHCTVKPFDSNLKTLSAPLNRLNQTWKHCLHHQTVWIKRENIVCTIKPFDSNV